MTHPRPSSFAVPACLFLAALSSATAEVKLPPLFSDHLVLQRSAQTPVWGTAEPGEAVALTLGDVHAAATAGPDGRWRADLDLTKAGDGPLVLAVEGKNKLEVQDVVVGQVWLASGQSNMAFGMSAEAHAAAEIPQSADAGLRQFRVLNNTAETPAAEVGGKWVVAGPATTGGFTAVGYYFGKELRQTLHVPLGLINSTWGGTPVESWTSAGALATVPALGDKSAKLAAEAAAYPAAQKDYVAALQAWQEKFHRQVPAPPDATAPAPLAAADAPGEWKTVTVPTKPGDAGLPDAGVVWLRRTVPLADADLKVTFPVDLSSANGIETVYWNGTRIGGGTPENPPPANHRYYVPAAAMKPGDNVLTVRLANPAGGLGLGAAPRALTLTAQTLSGEWQAQAEATLPADPAALAACPKPPAQPTVAWNRGSTLYNGMIAPLAPCALAGAIWYQGENNAGRGFQYRTALPLMIQDWRRRWGWDFPFYLEMLPNFGGKAPTPGDSGWADLREAQAKTAASLPNVGYAVIIDVGEELDIHPKDKMTPGTRLAQVALGRTYNQPVAWMSPTFAKAAVEGDKIRVSFAPGGGKLVARPLPDDYAPSSVAAKRVPLVRDSPGSELEGFAVCGEDHKWAWATAKIDGDTVLAWSPQVPQPVAVRYAWANNPTCNLYNDAGLPAAPFRSDDFPVPSEKVLW